MENYRRLSEMPRATDVPDAGQAVERASTLLMQLIPLPSSQSVGPLSLMQALERKPKPDTTSSTIAAVRDPAETIVSQAASILDEEMAKGILAARQVSPGSSTTEPASGLLRQVHDVVDQVARIWPMLERGSSGLSAADVDPLAELRPGASVRPGQRATIAMTLRNSESHSVHLIPMATELLGSRGGRIPCALLEFVPTECQLEPQEQMRLTISTAIPGDAAPGCYSGLLVVRGVDYLRALITIEVL